MYDKILLPVDGSDGTERVAEHAVEMAARYDASLCGLYVLEVGDRSPGVDDPEKHEAFRNRGERTLSTVASLAEEADVPFETAFLRGDVAKSITTFADERDADVIVMGTHSRTGLDRYVVGSVTESVVRQTHRPVFVVDLEEPEAA